MASIKPLFINRELSWLAFNRRVLQESVCPSLPAFERLKFLAIFCSNLDEFFMIRVGSLSDQALLKSAECDNKTGMSAREQISAVLSATRPLYKEAADCYESVSRALRHGGVRHENVRELPKEDKGHLKEHFTRQILPLLSAQVVDSRHPFPHLENKLVYVVVELENEKGKTSVGFIPVSRVLERVVFLKSREGQVRFVLCEEVIRRYLRQIFRAYKVKSSALVRVTRNADLSASDSFSDEEMDYRDHMKEILRRRDRLAPVRLEFSAGAPRSIVRYLQEKLSLPDEATFFLHFPLELGYIYTLQSRFSQTQREKLLHREAPPRFPRSFRRTVSITEQVQSGDRMLFYPYDSMKPFLDLLAESARDPAVVSIKMTLYRLSQNSQVISLLSEAAENGKEVTVLLELKARFDEENNISLSRTLEEAGCHVLYGVSGYKVHSKICLITRRESDGVHTLCHIGTGNYNEKTARLYSDLSIFTARREICEDAVRFFHNLTTNNPHGDYRTLVVAPKGFKPRMLELIEEQTALGARGRICLKMNSLTDKQLIESLIRASQSGVRVDLIIRGICCLNAQVKGKTDNIHVRSIVGRYLEHARIFLFGPEGEEKVFLSSADFMTRNTQRRVEIATPVLDPGLRQRLCQILHLQLQDNVKAHRLCEGGVYEKITDENAPIDSQMAFFSL